MLWLLFNPTKTSQGVKIHNIYIYGTTAEFHKYYSYDTNVNLVKEILNVTRSIRRQQNDKNMNFFSTALYTRLRTNAL